MVIGLKGALEQQNMRYEKISHIWASEQAGRFGGCWGGESREENKWWTGNGLCVLEMMLGGGESWGQRREAHREGGGWGWQGLQARNMFWNINLRFWPWAGAQRWKKSRGTFEARECSLHSWSRLSTDGQAAGEQQGQVQRVSLSHLRALVSTPTIQLGAVCI